MTKIFYLKNGEIKVMWNEQPLLKDYSYDWTKKLIPIKTYKLFSSFSVGVETKIHTGGRIYYGMLVAKVQPSTRQDCVEVDLAFTQENTVKYNDSCLINNDSYVYKGLPQEYIEQIMNQICSTILEKEYYPQCKIIIEDSANCEVGSSPMIFGMIANIIVNIISANSQDEIYNMDTETFIKKIRNLCCI